MPRVSQLNKLPEKRKVDLYKKLIPVSIFEQFKIDKNDFMTPNGEKAVSIVADEHAMEAIIKVKLKAGDPDEIYHIEVGDSNDMVQLQWDYIHVTDPHAPRFATNVVNDAGESRWLNWSSRNIREEVRAMASGLAPGQIKRGLGLATEIDRCLDEFCEAADLKSITLEAVYYHTAIMFERHGYRYFKGFKLMNRINELFNKCEDVRKLLDGSSPFRLPDFCRTVRGRSWAIHDGVLDDLCDGVIECWEPPKMIRMAGKRHNVDTFNAPPY